MGSFGYMPDSSDTALDRAAGIEKHLEKALNKKLGKMETGVEYDFAGVVILLLRKGFKIEKKHIRRALSVVRLEYLSIIFDGEIEKPNIGELNMLERLIAEFEKLLYGECEKLKKFFMGNDLVSIKDLPDYQNSLIFKGKFEYFKA
jgi:hypothetical protein